MSNASKVVRQLIRGANRHAGEVIENEAIARGFLWRCRDKDCAYANDEEDLWCLRCHRSQRV
jgi:hypothetical protein